MRIEKIVCDKCRKETNDVHAEIGWIHIRGATDVSSVVSSITQGRGSGGCAKIEHFKDFHEAHLCSIPCLVGFIFERGETNEKDKD